MSARRIDWVQGKGSIRVVFWGRAKRCSASISEVLLVAETLSDAYSEYGEMLLPLIPIATCQLA